MHTARNFAVRAVSGRGVTFELGAAGLKEREAAVSVSVSVSGQP